MFKSRAISNRFLHLQKLRMFQKILANYWEGEGCSLPSRPPPAFEGPVCERTHQRVSWARKERTWDFSTALYGWLVEKRKAFFSKRLERRFILGWFGGVYNAWRSPSRISEISVSLIVNRRSKFLRTFSVPGRPIYCKPLCKCALSNSCLAFNNCKAMLTALKNISIVLQRFLFCFFSVLCVLHPAELCVCFINMAGITGIPMCPLNMLHGLKVQFVQIVLTLGQIKI